MDPKVIDFMNQLQQSASQMGRQMLDMAVLTMYWQSLVYLCIGGVLTLAGLLFLIPACRRIMAILRENGDVPPTVIGYAISGIVGILSLICGLWQTLNPWNWIGVLSPRIALFYQIYDKLVNK